MYEINILITSSFIYIGNLTLVNISLIISSIGSMVKVYYCPRCKMKKVIEYPDSIVCPDCSLEFDKEQIGIIPDDEILAHGEMHAVIDSFEELKDPEKAQKFFDSVQADLEELNDED